MDRLWGERLAEQAGWEGETDPERLTRAFAALDAAGITARENLPVVWDGNPDRGLTVQPISWRRRLAG